MTVDYGLVPAEAVCRKAGDLTMDLVLEPAGSTPTVCSSMIVAVAVSGGREFFDRGLRSRACTVRHSMLVTCRE